MERGSGPVVTDVLDLAVEALLAVSPATVRHIQLTGECHRVTARHVTMLQLI